MKCFVPDCKLETTKFFTVPYTKERFAWFAAVGKRLDHVNLKSTYYCCEYHIQVILKSVQDSGANRIRNEIKIGSISLSKFESGWYIEPIIGNAKLALAKTISQSPLIRKETVCQSTQTADILCESKSIQTNAISQSTQHQLKSVPQTDNSKVDEEFVSSFSTVTTATDRSSNLDEYLPDSSVQTTSDSDSSGKKFGICQTTILIMKNRPKHYMGINKKCIHVIKHLMNKTQLTEVQIMLTLRKIRLNEEFQTLADLFDIERRTAGKFFQKSVGPIAKNLKKFLKYVKPSTVKRNLPVSFRRNYCRIGAILDCFEIQIEKPSKPTKQSKSWSNYKKCNTVKYLICVTPDGLIYYISNGYGGRSSDVVITTASKLHKALKSEYFVMADRGFKGIEDVLLKKGAKLFRPPSATTDQMAKKDVKLTKQIASLRIHVERSIGRVRDFNMCKPHITLDSNLVKYIDNVVKIACGLANLQNQLIKTN